VQCSPLKLERHITRSLAQELVQIIEGFGVTKYQSIWLNYKILMGVRSWSFPGRFSYSYSKTVQSEYFIYWMWRSDWMLFRVSAITKHRAMTACLKIFIVKFYVFKVTVNVIKLQWSIMIIADLNGKLIFLSKSKP